MSRLILLLSTSVGAGHTRAAEAVEAALREIAPDVETTHVDVLSLTNAMFRRIYGTAYLDLVNKMPHALGYFYDLLDQEPSPSHRSDRLRRVVQRMNLGRFIRLLKSKSWDAVVNTHFLSADIIAGLKQKDEFPPPQTTVVTDFEAHRLWANEPCEHYFTASTEGSLQLHHWGVPKTATTLTGIPIHPAFSRTKNRAECQQKHGVTGDRPVILQLAGGFGVGPIEQIFCTILSLERPMELIVVSGRNAELKARLERCPVPPRHRAKVLGFTTEMHELMCAADIVVSKPGGLTTSEILASGAAMTIVNPIPGQESRNSDLLLENGAAVKANSTATLAYKLDQLLASPEHLGRIKENAARLGRPRAAFEIAQSVLALADAYRAKHKSVKTVGAFA
jgi:processive 1,2-diacylglycerol beta-glucosyltransferase